MAQEQAMTKIITALVVLQIAACSVILPIPHDPVMFGYLIDTKIAVDRLSCDEKTWAWETAQSQIERLKVYSTLRHDPQAEAAVKLEDAIKKAKDSNNKTFCESILKLNKTRIDVIVDAWKGR